MLFVLFLCRSVTLLLRGPTVDSQFWRFGGINVYLVLIVSFSGLTNIPGTKYCAGSIFVIYHGSCGTFGLWHVDTRCQTSCLIDVSAKLAFGKTWARPAFILSVPHTLYRYMTISFGSLASKVFPSGYSKSVRVSACTQNTPNLGCCFL